VERSADCPDSHDLASMVLSTVSKPKPDLDELAARLDAEPTPS
jgi:hypothetical protein